MTDILLIYPPYQYELKSPPLGLMYLASYVRRKGYTVEICDLNITPMDHEGISAYVAERRPKIVGISFMTMQAAEAASIAAIAKAAVSDVKVIVGGPHPSAVPGEAAMSGFVDFVVVGEGEITFLELVEALLEVAHAQPEGQRPDQDRDDENKFLVHG